MPDASVLVDVEATESAVKKVHAPKMLHIATHGFFLQDAGGAAPTDNPMLRSGLALAGANAATVASEDGILTALEAAQLDLWGTKLVTLSACDTGIGVVRNGDGVYGLRRSIVLAGAETLVMSLWPVSDAVTREMMTAYYTGLTRGLGRGDALRQVQLAMLKRPARRHPFYWASFIQAGEWASLDGHR
jgi:CHAT domain-containing protein